MIQIKTATLDDASIITTISKISFIESHGSSASQEDINNYTVNNFSLDVITGELKDKKNNYYLIYHNNVAAGYSNIIFDSPVNGITDYAITKLDRLYLLKEFYDLKLGVQLLNFNLELSKNKLQNGMWLQVWTENLRAVNFYKKTGFKAIANASFKISETHSNPNYLMYKKY